MKLVQILSLLVASFPYTVITKALVHHNTRGFNSSRTPPIISPTDDRQKYKCAGTRVLFLYWKINGVKLNDWNDLVHENQTINATEVTTTETEIIESHLKIINDHLYNNSFLECCFIDEEEREFCSGTTHFIPHQTLPRGNSTQAEAVTDDQMGDIVSPDMEDSNFCVYVAVGVTVPLLTILIIIFVVLILCMHCQRTHRRTYDVKPTTQTQPQN